MSIAPIPSVPGIPNLPETGVAGALAPAGAGTDSFSSAIGTAVDALQKAQATASTAEAQAAAGQGSLADTMIAASRASLDTQVTNDLINRALTAYQSIMQMSV